LSNDDLMSEKFQDMILRSGFSGVKDRA